MSFSFRCPACNHEYHKLEDSLRGKKIRCRCGKKIRLGQAVSTAARSARSKTGKASDTELPEAIPVGHWPGSTESKPAGVVTSKKSPSPGGLENVQQPGNRSIVRMLAGMASGTLAILFSLLAFLFGGRLLQIINSSPPPGAVASEGLEASLDSFVLGLNVYCITALLVSVAYLFGGLAQIIMSWKQVSGASRSWWPDLFVVATSMIAIVAVIAVWSYLDVQTSQILDMDRSIRAWGTEALSNPGLSDEEATKIRGRLDDHEQMLEGVAADTRWFLFKQLMIHVVIPGIVVGLSLFRLLKTPSTDQPTPQKIST